MKSTSTAEAISAQLLALLPQHPAEATVHSVFHTSANLLYQGQLVTLLDDTRDAEELAKLKKMLNKF